MASTNCAVLLIRDERLGLGVPCLPCDGRALANQLSVGVETKDWLFGTGIPKLPSHERALAEELSGGGGTEDRPLGSVQFGVGADVYECVGATYAGRWTRDERFGGGKANGDIAATSGWHFGEYRLMLHVLRVKSVVIQNGRMR